jgi:hypothetical protein
MKLPAGKIALRPAWFICMRERCGTVDDLWRE